METEMIDEFKMDPLTEAEAINVSQYIKPTDWNAVRIQAASIIWEG
jgi:hypothetical protein